MLDVPVNQCPEPLKLEGGQALGDVDGANRDCSGLAVHEGWAVHRKRVQFASLLPDDHPQSLTVVLDDGESGRFEDHTGIPMMSPGHSEIMSLAVPT
jgi:hypothetical protein